MLKWLRCCHQVARLSLSILHVWIPWRMPWMLFFFKSNSTFVFIYLNQIFNKLRINQEVGCRRSWRTFKPPPRSLTLQIKFKLAWRPFFLLVLNTKSAKKQLWPFRSNLLDWILFTSISNLFINSTSISLIIQLFSADFRTTFSALIKHRIIIFKLHPLHSSYTRRPFILLNIVNNK